MTCLTLFFAFMFCSNLSSVPSVFTCSQTFSSSDLSSNIIISFPSSSLSICSSSFWIEFFEFKRLLDDLLFSTIEVCYSLISNLSLKSFSMLSKLTTDIYSFVSPPPRAVLKSFVVFVSLSDLIVFGFLSLGKEASWDRIFIELRSSKRTSPF